MKELLKALSEFRAEVPAFKKSKKGYGYSYTPLPDIIEVINPLMQKYGLIFTQYIDSNETSVCVQTVISHIESGEAISSKTCCQIQDLKGMNRYQTLGSAITYLRRYDLSTILGLTTEEDTDGAGQPEDEKPKQKQEETIWLTKDQFETTMQSEAKAITAVINKYNNKPYAI